MGTLNSECMWTLGQNVSGFTRRNFGGVSEYGHLLRLTYLNGTSTVQRYNDFRRVISNPC